MSRVGSGDVQYVKATNNVYTVLVVVATIVQVLAFVVLYTRFQTVFGIDLFHS